MNIKKQAWQLAKKCGRSLPYIRNKAVTAAWDTGVGPLLSAAPGIFGEQAVLAFPGRSGKFTLPCTEYEGNIALAVTREEFSEIQTYINNNPSGEIWLKNGWYTVWVRPVPQSEQAAIMDSTKDTSFFGKAGAVLGRKSLKDCRLLCATRTAPCTGTSGPGTKTWIWPVICAFLLLTRGKKRAKGK